MTPAPCWSTPKGTPAGSGHRYIGCEHLLLALVGIDQACAVLRERGLTPGRVEEEIVRRAGTGAGAGLFADLDRAALASIGIDLDAVRARIDASFGQDALTRADRAVHRTTRRPGPARGRLIHRWRHQARVRRVPPVRAVAPAPQGRYQAADQPAGHIPFTPGAKKCLENTLREAVAQHQTGMGVEHLALALLVTNRGLVPPILDRQACPPRSCGPRSWSAAARQADQRGGDRGPRPRSWFTSVHPIGRRRVTHLVDGATIAVTMATATAAAASVLRSGGITPTLAVLVPTDDPGAAWYVRSIQRAAARTGIACQVHRMGGQPVASAAEIRDRLAELSRDPAVHGVICQTPLPPGADLPGVGSAIPAGQ